MPLCKTKVLSMLHLNGQTTIAVSHSSTPFAMPTRRSALLLLTTTALLVLVVAGCDALVDRPALTIEFGSAYTVRFGENVTETGGAVRSTPYTDILGTLHVAVEFSGGCASHFFQVDYVLSETTATIWLVHSANGDPCEAILTQEVSVRLPRAVLEKDDLILVSPSGRDEPITRYDNADGGP